MKKSSAGQQLQILSNLKDIKSLFQEQSAAVKGGVLLYCEEKRRKIFGISYTSTQWKVANDGSLWLTVKM